VIRTDPPAGEEAESGTRIAVFVSAGAETVAVPDLVGRTQAEAQAILEQEGFTLGEVTTRSDAEAEEGQIIAQSPPAASEAAPGSPIDIVVSQGPDLIEIPNVDNLPQAEALSRLSNEGVTFELVSEYSDSVERGRVIRTEPPGGET